MMHAQEGLEPQRDHVAACAQSLGEALNALAVEAKAAARVAGRGKVPDLTSVVARHSEVRVAEEALDLAALDLATASGQDA